MNSKAKALALRLLTNSIAANGKTAANVIDLDTPTAKGFHWKEEEYKDAVKYLKQNGYGQLELRDVYFMVRRK